MGKDDIFVAKFCKYALIDSFQGYAAVIDSSANCAALPLIIAPKNPLPQKLQRNSVLSMWLEGTTQNPRPTPAVTGNSVLVWNLITTWDWVRPPNPNPSVVQIPKFARIIFMAPLTCFVQEIKLILPVWGKITKAGGVQRQQTNWPNVTIRNVLWRHGVSY